jgi:PiT family inorganic phosphate transporter
MIITLLVLSLLAACVFEFINGFHDTANSVATVIYTKSLEPTTAVVWSGFMNFLGLITGGVGVTMANQQLIFLVRELLDQWLRQKELKTFKNQH